MTQTRHRNWARHPIKGGEAAFKLSELKRTITNLEARTWRKRTRHVTAGTGKGIEIGWGVESTWASQLPTRVWKEQRINFCLLHTGTPSYDYRRQRNMYSTCSWMPVHFCFRNLFCFCFVLLLSVLIVPFKDFRIFFLSFYENSCSRRTQRF